MKKHSSFPPGRLYCKRETPKTIISYAWLFKLITYWFWPTKVIVLQCGTHIHALILQVKITRKDFHRASEYIIQKTFIVHLQYAKLCSRYCFLEVKINNIFGALKKHVIIYQYRICMAFLIHILSSDFHKYSLK